MRRLRSLAAFLAVCTAALLAGAASSPAAPVDTQPPTVPQGMAFAGKSRTTVRVIWRASTDDVGVAGYHLYRNGLRVATVHALAHTFTGLRCATRYTFALEAVDAAGNASYRAEATGSITTSACAQVIAPKPRPAPTPAPAPKRSVPKAGKANLWIDQDGGSCARRAAASAYIGSRACRTLQAAYNAARSGDTINIADGTYGSQTLAAGTKRLVFRAVGPGRPSFGQIISAASNVLVRGILIQDRDNLNGPCSDPDNAVLYPCGANQTFENVIVDGLNAGDDHGIRGVGDGFTLRASVVRNIRDQKGFESGANDMLIENNLWHSITVTKSEVHNECMYVDGGNRSVFRGNRFVGCPTMALFFTNSGDGAPYRDVQVENNVFGHTLGDDGAWHPSCAFKIGSGASYQNRIDGWRVHYNTFETSPCVDELPGSGSTWIGNLGGIDCVRTFTYRHNVGETCGGPGEIKVGRAVNSRAAPNQAPFYVDAPAGNFRLRAGAAAINRGDPVTFPKQDGDRKRRPLGGAPDAGAYERS